MRARSTRLAGSVRDCDIDLNFSKSASPSDNSIARRHAAISFNPHLKPQTSYMEPGTTDESHAYDNFQGIDRLATYMILVPLFDLKFLNELAAKGAGTSNLRH